MLDIDIQRLTKLDHEWREIEDSYRLEPYNAPINLTEEKYHMLAAFKRGDTYNPDFKYDNPPEFPVKHIHQFIHSLQPENSMMEEIYYLLAQNELLAIQAVLSHAPSIITGYTSLIYGLPDNGLMQLAQSILSTDQAEDRDDTDTERLSAEQAAQEMQSMLEVLRLNQWKALTFSPMSGKIAVSQKDQYVKIRKDSIFSRSDLRRLLVHEIGVHVIRAENGRKQPLSIFSHGLPGYLDTEEGLAVFSEEKAGVLESNTMRKYAARVIATSIALGNSFNDVFYGIVKEVGPETAFEITARVKRGFRDTSQIGAHTKDIVYLLGYRNVSQYLEKHPEDYDILFIGKFGLHDLNIVKSLTNSGTLHPASLMPSSIK